MSAARGAEHDDRRSAIDGRTTRHEGYDVSQRKRKRVEESLRWLKTVALQRKTRFRGKDRVGWMFTLAAAAYNLFECGTDAAVCIRAHGGGQRTALGRTEALNDGARKTKDRQIYLQKRRFSQPLEQLIFGTHRAL